MEAKPAVRLEIRTDREWYIFHADGKEMGRASIASFATEGTMYMTFTGTLLGIFSEDGGHSPVHFSEYSQKMAMVVLRKASGLRNESKL